MFKNMDLLVKPSSLNACLDTSKWLEMIKRFVSHVLIYLWRPTTISTVITTCCFGISLCLCTRVSHGWRYYQGSRLCLFSHLVWPFLETVQVKFIPQSTSTTCKYALRVFFYYINISVYHVKHQEQHFHWLHFTMADCQRNEKNHRRKQSIPWSSSDPLPQYVCDCCCCTTGLPKRPSPPLREGSETAPGCRVDPFPDYPS